MERVAHIFLHKVGSGQLVRSVLKTLFIDSLKYVFCSDLRPKRVFFCFVFVFVCFCMSRKL